MDETPRRHWFRFGLRTLFALMTLACIAVGWISYQLYWIERRQQAKLEMSRERIGAVYKGAAVYSHEVRAPGFLWLFGETGEREIVLFRNVITDEEAVRFKSLFPETRFTYMPADTW